MPTYSSNGHVTTTENMKSKNQSEGNVHHIQYHDPNTMRQ